MIDPTKLIGYLREADLPEAEKNKLIAVAQVASEEDKEHIWKIVQEYKKKKSGEKIMITKEQAEHLLQKAREIRNDMFKKGEKLLKKKEKNQMQSLEKEMEDIFSLS